MHVLAVVAALVVLAIALAITVPITLHIHAQGKANSSAWQFGGALDIWPWTIGVAAAARAGFVLQIQLAGRRVLLWRPSATAKKPSPKPEKPREPWTLDRASKLWRDIERWLDIQDTLRFLLGMHSYARLIQCKGKLTYSTSDVAWTGMLLGALYGFAGLAAPVGQFDIEPVWDDELHAEGNINTTVRLWPGRAVAAVVYFLLTNMKWRAPKPQPNGNSVPAHT